VKVFISWSGERSRVVASMLGEWLPDVIGGIKTFVSDDDIAKGARWQTVIANELDEATFGIVCITRDRLTAPWLNFEAGALSRRAQENTETPVATLLLDISNPGEVPQPLAQFNATVATKDDIFKLVKSINKSMGEEAAESHRLTRLFNRGWSELEKALLDIGDAPEPVEPANEADPVLTEILSIVRELQRTNVTETAVAAAELLGLVQNFSGGGRLVTRIPDQYPTVPPELSIAPGSIRFADGTLNPSTMKFPNRVSEVPAGHVVSAPEARIRIIRKAIERIAPTLGIDEQTAAGIRIAWIDPEEIEIQLPDVVFAEGPRLSTFIYSLEGIVPGQQITYRGIRSGELDAMLAAIQAVRDSLIGTLDAEGLSPLALRPSHTRPDQIEILVPDEIHVSVYAHAAEDLFNALPTLQRITFLFPDARQVASIDRGMPLHVDEQPGASA
jgi:hypothetical protein